MNRRTAKTFERGEGHQHRATDGRYDHKDGALCACGHPRGEHRDSTGGPPTRCDSVDNQTCECVKFRSPVPSRRIRKRAK